MKGMPMDTKPAEINGTNIIGMFPGKFWGTQQDNPLIIGAHWDTTETTVGFNDNGSCVTVVLESARILVSCEFSQEFSARCHSF